MAYLPQNNNQSPLKTLRSIFLALLAGQCLFMVAVLSITQNKGLSFNTAADPLLFVAPVIAIASLVAGPIISNKVLADAANKETVREKLMVYQTAFIIRAALLEGASLLSIVSYMKSGNLFYIAIAGLMILIFITLYPTNDRVTAALGISTADLEPEL
jgi:uncharacterized membrane protein